MKVIFLGTGEAFDENIPNNSHLVITDKTNLILDCGYSIPPQLWKFNPDPNFLDAVYISHQHADHYFGLPAVFMRMWEGGREKDITAVCPKKLKKSFIDFMNLAYTDFQKKFKYKINLIAAEEGQIIKFQDINLSFEKTIHSGENLAIKISDGKNIIAYTGDGSPTPGTDFYKNLDLLISETYLYDKEIIGHSSIISAIAFAENNNVKCLALTHINRDFRKNELPKIKNKITSEKVKIIMPEPLEEYVLENRSIM
jgi:ribonuclease BN (tRNA processing enzyme)